jgi:hypothetical protein
MGRRARNADPEWAAPDQDAAWFEANPRRSHRVREYVRGEFPLHNILAKDNGWRLGVAVRQVKPGVRIRTGFWIIEAWTLEDVPEHVAAALFDWTFKAFCTGEIGDVSELFAQIHRDQQASNEVH